MRKLVDVVIFLWDILHVALVHGAYGEHFGCMKHRGGGRMVGANVPGEQAFVEVILQRKIVEGDVNDGILTTIVSEGVLRRGGKRYIRFTLSPQIALDLASVIRDAAVVARRRQNAQLLLRHFESMIVVMQERSHKTISCVRILQ